MEEQMNGMRHQGLKEAREWILVRNKVSWKRVVRSHLSHYIDWNGIISFHSLLCDNNRYPWVQLLKVYGFEPSDILSKEMMH